MPLNFRHLRGECALGKIYIGTSFWSIKPTSGTYSILTKLLEVVAHFTVLYIQEVVDLFYIVIYYIR